MTSPRHLRKAANFPAKSEPLELARAGLAYLEQGDFQKALLLMEIAQPYLPNLDWLHLNLAALLGKLRHFEVGQAMYRGYLERNPLQASGEADDADVLVIRGFDETYPILTRGSNGRFGATLRGGHFTLQYLLRDKKTPSRQIFTIAGHRGMNGDLLPNFKLMLNTMADADVEYSSLVALQNWVEQNPDTAIINHPARILQTTRDGNFHRLQSIDGVEFPHTVKFTFENANAREVEQAISAHPFTPPFIFRQAGTHTARTVELLHNRDQLNAYVGDGLSGVFYAISYRDIRWRNDYFRKLRVFSIGGEIFPVVCHLDKVWNVHGGNRKEIMRTSQTLMQEEQNFLADWKSYVGTRAVQAVEKLVEKTGLDFFGMDFNVTDTGDVFIYELNASMRHSFDHAQNFPYKRPYDEAISTAFEKMVMSHLAAT